MIHTARLGLLVVLAAACGREQAQPGAARRWDTSQRDFRVPPDAIIAVAAPRLSGGIDGAYIRGFLDEFDAAADSLQRLGYTVGVSFRDSLYVVDPIDTLRLASLPAGERSGYHFLTLGRPPHFVPGTVSGRRLVHAGLALQATVLRQHQAEAAVLKPAAGDTLVIATSTVIAIVPSGVQPPTDGLARARSYLQASGIGLRVVSADSVLIRRGRDVRWLSTAGPRDRVWFYIVSPTRGPAVTIGFTTDSALVGAARRYLSGSDIPSQAHWDSAARAIRRLPIAAFALPAAFAQELAFMGCSVPQSFAGSGRHNVIKGVFAARGQVDWAALCSRDGASMIIVHWGGPAQCPRQFPAVPDRGFLQDIGDGKTGYSREIVTADSERIMNIGVYGEDEELDSAPSRARSAPEHEGIEDVFLEKASSVWYCAAGRWVMLGGAD